MNRRDVLKMSAAFLVAPLVRLCPQKRPTVYTWRGVDGRFDDPNNWTPRGVPGKGDSVVIHSGTLDFAGCVGPLKNVTITGGNVGVSRGKAGPMLWNTACLSASDILMLEAAYR